MHRLIGSDPELFLIKKDGFVSSVGLIGGSKQAPRDIGNGCAVQEDNVAVEFNIPPAKTCEAFIKSINLTLDYLTDHATRLDLQLSIVPSAVFSSKELAKPGANTFGCEPDFNCWTKRKNPHPACDNPNLRSAGGHVHIGADGLDAWELGRAADLFLGVPSLQFDQDTERRKLYGKAGSIRRKPYGVEYRTLSNFWIQTDELKAWVYTQAHRAIDFVEGGAKLSDEEGLSIQRCINEGDLSLMKELVAQYGI